MRILIADDDPHTYSLLKSMLIQWGYDVVLAKNGKEALEILQQDDPPPLAILDRLMPGIDGATLCRKVRENPNARPNYLILLTGMSDQQDIVEGLRAGADDYVTKPFNVDELQARVQIGVRMIELQSVLMERVEQLETALSHIKRLQGLLPICSYCKRIRDDQKYWQEIELYISEHSDAEFSHVICPDCNETIAKPEIEQARLQKETKSFNKHPRKK
jgi:CheY-like chemotaxis protein